MSMPTTPYEPVASEAGACLPEESTLTLQGPLTVSDAERLYQMLAAAIQENGFVNIHLGDVTHIDLAAMQILVAAARDGVVELRTGGKALNADVLRQFQLSGQSHQLVDG